MRCVYDELLDLTALGQVRIARGSHVEPDEREIGLQTWGRFGPRLGPFERRSQALEAEREWLEKNWM